MRMRQADHGTDAHPSAFLMVRYGLNNSCTGTWKPWGSNWEEKLTSRSRENQWFRLPPADQGRAGGDTARALYFPWAFVAAIAHDWLVYTFGFKSSVISDTILVLLLDYFTNWPLPSPWNSFVSWVMWIAILIMLLTITSILWSPFAPPVSLCLVPTFILSLGNRVNTQDFSCPCAWMSSTSLSQARNCFFNIWCPLGISSLLPTWIIVLTS